MSKMSTLVLTSHFNCLTLERSGVRPPHSKKIKNKTKFVQGLWHLGVVQQPQAGQEGGSLGQNGGGRPPYSVSHPSSFSSSFFFQFFFLSF
jgi:hypothetical protein